MSITLIATTSVTSASNTIVMSAIPQTYETLLVKINVADSTSGTGRNDFWAVFNSDNTSGANYNSSRMLFYDGNNKLGGFTSDAASGHAMPGTGNGARFGAYEFVISNYTNTTICKTIHAQGGYAAASNQAFLNNVTYINTNNTQAVSSITFKAAGGGQFAVNSLISIYGLK